MGCVGLGQEGWVYLVWVGSIHGGQVGCVGLVYVGSTQGGQVCWVGLGQVGCVPTPVNRSRSSHKIKVNSLRVINDIPVITHHKNSLITSLFFVNYS